MRLFVSGSAPLLAQTHADWRARTGHAILERYGMTETGMNTSNPYDGERVAGTVGLPLPGVDVRVMAEAGPAPAGSVGMIEVRGPNVCAGYWRNPEKTAEAFSADGFFVTGDLGQCRRPRLSLHRRTGQGPDHHRRPQRLSQGGRERDRRHARGDRERGDRHAHDDLGEAVTAVVAAAPSSRPSEAEVIAALKDRLARFKQPKRVVFVEELPRNAMGKVQKARLREQYAGLYRGAVAPVA